MVSVGLRRQTLHSRTHGRNGLEDKSLRRDKQDEKDNIFLARPGELQLPKHLFRDAHSSLKSQKILLIENLCSQRLR